MENSENVHILIKDVEKMFVHYNHFFETDCSQSVRDKMTKMMVERMEKVIKKYNEKIKHYEN